MYGKIFSQLVYSSLTQNETIETRGVFFMLIAIADKSGCVLGTDEAVARVINVPQEQFDAALVKLMSPDASSASKEYEGRRVIRLQEQPGLFLVNYEKYAEIASDEERREYFRVKKRESREKLEGKKKEGRKASAPAT